MSVVFENVRFLQILTTFKKWQKSGYFHGYNTLYLTSFNNNTKGLIEIVIEIWEKKIKDGSLNLFLTSNCFKNITSGGFAFVSSIMFGINLGKWQKMKTATIAIEILSSILFSHYYWRQSKTAFVQKMLDTFKGSNIWENCVKSCYL